MQHAIVKLFKLAILLFLLLLGYWIFVPLLPSVFFWPSFDLACVVWFVYQYRKSKNDKKRVVRGLEIGMVLVAANLFVNYYFGALQGAYIIGSNYSLLYVLGNPVELLIGSFFGGAGWFMYVPKKFDKLYSTVDILLLGFFGMATEIMLIQNGLLTYLTVDSLNAFLTYAGLWLILHFIYYKVLE